MPQQTSSNRFQEFNTLLQLGSSTPLDLHDRLPVKKEKDNTLIQEGEALVLQLPILATNTDNLIGQINPTNLFTHKKALDIISSFETLSNESENALAELKKLDKNNDPKVRNLKDALSKESKKINDLLTELKKAYFGDTVTLSSIETTSKNTIKVSKEDWTESQKSADKEPDLKKIKSEFLNILDSAESKQENPSTSHKESIKRAIKKAPRLNKKQRLLKKTQKLLTTAQTLPAHAANDISSDTQYFRTWELEKEITRLLNPLHLSEQTKKDILEYNEAGKTYVETHFLSQETRSYLKLLELAKHKIAIRKLHRQHKETPNPSRILTGMHDVIAIAQLLFDTEISGKDKETKIQPLVNKHADNLSFMLNYNSCLFAYAKQPLPQSRKRWLLNKIILSNVKIRLRKNINYTTLLNSNAEIIHPQTAFTNWLTAIEAKNEIPDRILKRSFVNLCELPLKTEEDALAIYINLRQYRPSFTIPLLQLNKSFRHNVFNYLICSKNPDEQNYYKKHYEKMTSASDIVEMIGSNPDNITLLNYFLSHKKKFYKNFSHEDMVTLIVQNNVNINRYLFDPKNPLWKRIHPLLTQRLTSPKDNKDTLLLLFSNENLLPGYSFTDEQLQALRDLNDYFINNFLSTNPSTQKRWGKLDIASKNSTLVVAEGLPTPKEIMKTESTTKVKSQPPKPTATDTATATTEETNSDLPDTDKASSTPSTPSKRSPGKS